MVKEKEAAQIDGQTTDTKPVSTENGTTAAENTAAGVEIVDEAPAKSAPAKRGAGAKAGSSPKEASHAAGADTAPAIPAALAKIGRDAMRCNPSLEAVWVSSDGVAFGSECDARNHARTLECKDVVSIIR